MKREVGVRSIIYNNHKYIGLESLVLYFTSAKLHSLEDNIDDGTREACDYALAVLESMGEKI